MYIVYKTTNLITGEFYIGTHKVDDKDDDYLGSGVRVKESVNQYGRDNFIRETIREFNNATDAIEYEHALIKEAKKDGLCLNISSGGTNFDYINNNNLNNSVNNCKKGAEEFQKLYNSDSEFAEKWLQSLRQVMESPETRKKISAGLKGNKHFLNHTHSESSKKINVPKS